MTSNFLVKELLPIILKYSNIHNLCSVIELLPTLKIRISSASLIYKMRIQCLRKPPPSNVVKCNEIKHALETLKLWKNTLKYFKHCYKTIFFFFLASRWVCCVFLWLFINKIVFFIIIFAWAMERSINIYNWKKRTPKIHQSLSSLTY